MPNDYTDIYNFITSTLEDVENYEIVNQYEYTL